MSDGVTGNGPHATSGEALDSEGVSLLDLGIVLAKHKKLVAGLPLIAAAVAAGVSLLLPNLYTGVARILPPQQGQSTAAAMLNQFGGVLAGVAGQSLGVRNPNDLYVGMLKSRTVADSLIARFELKRLYERKTLDETRKMLEGKSKITAGKDSLITVEFEDKDPVRAAAVANGYVEELYKLTQSLAVTEASQRRLFFERQLDQTRKGLAGAEAAARKGLEKGGLVKVDDQGKALVENTARLRGQISVKEIQIGAMRAFAAERNPDLQQAQNELAAMKRELANMEGMAGGRDRAAGSAAPDGMENLRLLREVKYYETVYELLARQYEIAKIDEARDTALIQVLDKAVEPEGKSGPRRSLIVLVTTLAAALVAVMWAFLRESIARAGGNPEQASRRRALRSHLLGK